MYLLHRIIDSFPRISKWNIIRLKPVFGANKTGINLYDLYFDIVCNSMLYMIFQAGWEPVLIQWIVIRFEAILENACFLSHRNKDKYWLKYANDFYNPDQNILLNIMDKGTY